MWNKTKQFSESGVKGWEIQHILTSRGKEITESSKKHLKDFKSNTCKYCKEVYDPQHLEVDHRIAMCFGGNNDVMNLQVLCINCHRVKSIVERGLVHHFREMGWIVKCMCGWKIFRRKVLDRWV
jgi:hypothetical protein